MSSIREIAGAGECAVVMDHDRNRRRYGKADDELNDWFVQAKFIKAQIYDRGADISANIRASLLHDARIRLIEQNGMVWFDKVRDTIACLTPAHRRVAELVYSPHSAATWLADALSPPWGNGSLVQLAIGLPRAKLAAQDRMPGFTVLNWLTQRGRRAKDDLLTSLREDGEVLRIELLAAYEELRKVRVKRDQQAERDADKRRSERNMRFYTELTGKRAAKESDRLNRRLRRTG